MTAEELLFFDANPSFCPCTVPARGPGAPAPELTVKVSKTQISLRNRHVFACVSLPGQPGKRLAGGLPAALLRSCLSQGIPAHPAGGGGLSPALDPPRSAHRPGPARPRTAGLAGGGLRLCQRQVTPRGRKRSGGNADLCANVSPAFSLGPCAAAPRPLYWYTVSMAASTVQSPAAMPRTPS